MRYTGKLFHPAGANLYLDLAALSPIQGRLAFDVFAQLKTRMEQDRFSLQVDPSPAYPPLTLSFRRYGQTACTVTFSPGADDDDGAAAGDVDAALALLPRLDRNDDIAALGSLMNDGRLSMIAEGDFEAAHRHPGPLAAAYFASEESLNAPMLHGLMSLAGAAFFDRLGLLA